MNKAQLEQKILDVIDGMTNGERFEIYQEGCDCCDYMEDMVYLMDEFDELEGTRRHFSEIYKDLGSDFNFNDDYYYLDVYGMYRSFNDIRDTDRADVFDDIIDVMIMDKCDFGSPKIAKVFEEARSEEK